MVRYNSPQEINKSLNFIAGAGCKTQGLVSLGLWPQVCDKGANPLILSINLVSFSMSNSKLTSKPVKHPCG